MFNFKRILFLAFVSLFVIGPSISYAKEKVQVDVKITPIPNPAIASGISPEIASLITPKTTSIKKSEWCRWRCGLFSLSVAGIVFYIIYEIRLTS